NVLTAAEPDHRTDTPSGSGETMPLLLLRLHDGRAAWVKKLETLSDDDLRRTAVHPRLHQPIRLLDWIYLVAEHDDHHLALAREAILLSECPPLLVSGSEVADDRGAMTIDPESTSSARDLFEIPEDVTYLNCANMSPQLKSVTAVGLDAVR